MSDVEHIRYMLPYIQWFIHGGCNPLDPRQLRSSRQLYEDLGTEYGKAPPDETWEKELAGLKFKMYPSRGGPAGRGFIRLYTWCPHCGKHLTASRLTQHIRQKHLGHVYRGTLRRRFKEQVRRRFKEQGCLPPV